MGRVAAWVVAEIVAVAALVGSRGAFLRGGTEPDDAVALGLWLAAVAVATWLLLSTLACVAVASAPAVPAGLRRAVDALALPAVRRLVTRAAALSMAGSLALPAMGGAATVRTGRAPEPPSASTPAPMGVPGPGEVEPSVVSLPEQPAADPVTTPDPEVHRVLPGEHLWAIAAERVRATDPAAGDEQIAPYWVELVEQNRHRLASGDPDLVYPGEEILLPPR